MPPIFNPLIGLAIIFLWAPIIDFLLIGIPHHPRADQNHWQTEELAFTHPCDEQLSVVRFTEELDDEAGHTITDQE